MRQGFSTSRSEIWVEGCPFGLGLLPFLSGGFYLKYECIEYVPHRSHVDVKISINEKVFFEEKWFYHILSFYLMFTRYDLQTMKCTLFFLKRAHFKCAFQFVCFHVTIILFKKHYFRCRPKPLGHLPQKPPAPQNPDHGALVGRDFIFLSRGPNNGPTLHVCFCV